MPLPPHTPSAWLAPHGPSRALGHTPPAAVSARPREGQVPPSHAPAQTRRRFHGRTVFERVFFLRAEFCLLRLPDAAVSGLLDVTRPFLPPLPWLPRRQSLCVSQRSPGDALLFFQEIRSVFN